MASTTDRNSVLVISGYPGDSVSYDTQKQILDKIQATLTDQEVKYEILGRTFTCPMETIKYRANVLTRGESSKKVRNLTVILFGEASGTGTKPNTHAVRLDSDGYKGRTCTELILGRVAQGVHQGSKVDVVSLVDGSAVMLPTQKLPSGSTFISLCNHNQAKCPLNLSQLTEALQRLPPASDFKALSILKSLQEYAHTKNITAFEPVWSVDATEKSRPNIMDKDLGQEDPQRPSQEGGGSRTLTPSSSCPASEDGDVSEDEWLIEI